MDNKRYDVIFGGRLVEGAKPSEVLGRLCTVLELDQAAVKDLFKAGAGAVIRTGLDQAAAYALRERLRESGVVSTVRACAVEPPLEPLSSSMQTVTARETEPRSRPRELKPSWQPPAMPAPKGPGPVSMLFKVALLLALVGGGWWGYREWLAPPSPAFSAYASFAEAIARGQYQKAVEESTGAARGYAENWVRMTRPTTMKIYGKEYSTSPPSVSDIAGDIAWIKRKRKGEQKKSDTVVELQVEQTVCRIPPGVASALCKWPVTFQHEVEVQLLDGAWRVSSFKEVRLTPQGK